MHTYIHVYTHALDLYTCILYSKYICILYSKYASVSMVYVLYRKLYILTVWLVVKCKNIKFKIQKIIKAKTKLHNKKKINKNKYNCCNWPTIDVQSPNEEVNRHTHATPTTHIHTQTQIQYSPHYFFRTLSFANKAL